MQDTMTSVSLDARGISIDGKRQIVFCASLFYFRIPEGSWEDRMRKIRLAGYNCIDVYFPWNFHETRKDEWDFSSGMKDVDTFLSLAAKHDLFVMARPGPYICSEWDGGSLPAYLFAEGLPIRQNDDAYLARVEEWYQRILPIIARRQIDTGGSVVLMQVENELDFFVCADPPGYIQRLARSARSHGITVPLIACSGQNDIYGAWGKVEDVAPAMNLYLDSKMPGMETAISTFTRLIADFDAPLMVTEMGRDSLLMRRYLAAGAKLLGPYNQVAGFDFGFTTGINNWGDPVSFQTSYYDFRSLITPFGEIRPFVADDRVLSGVLASMGELLAGAFPREHCDTYTLQAADGSIETPPVLEVWEQPGADVISVSNRTEETQTYTVQGLSQVQSIEMPATSSMMVFSQVDLGPLGIPVVVDFATAEPVFLDSGENPVIVWASPVAGVVRVGSGGSSHDLTVLQDEETRVRVVLSDGRSLQMIGMGRSQAAHLTGVTDGEPEYLENPLPTDPLDQWPVTSESVGGERIGVSVSSHPTTNAGLFAAGTVVKPDQAALSLEQNGMDTGYGLYQIASRQEKVVGVVLHDAADVLSLYRGSAYLGTTYPAGCHQYVPIPQGVETSDTYNLRAEIWGHSNFDDSRKPALRISSLRGISALTEVIEARALPFWQSQSPSGGDVPYFSAFGGHLTTDRPTTTVWSTQLQVPPDIDSVLLNFDGIVCDGNVVVNGTPVGAVDVFSSLIDISLAVVPGEAAVISVELTKRHFSESGGSVSALLGIRSGPVTITAGDEQVFLKDADKAAERTAETAGSAAASAGTAAASASTAAEGSTGLPLVAKPGTLHWVSVDVDHPGRLPDCKLLLTGANCKVTAFYQGVICGRLVLTAEAGPRMVGAANVGYLPECWSEESGHQVRFLVEAIGAEDARVESIEVIPVQAYG